MNDLKMSREDLTEFLQRDFPQVAGMFEIVEVTPMQITVRMLVGDGHLRPGGTVSGPSMFALADVSAYLVILAMIGPRELAVTTSASIDFMRKPAAGQNVIARGELLKLGKNLAVTEIRLFSESDLSKVVCRGSLTYSLPIG